MSTRLYLSRNLVKFVSPLHYIYILLLLWKIFAFACLQNFEKLSYYADFCRQIPFHVCKKKCSSISKRNAGDGIFDSQFITTLDSFKKLSFLTGLRRKSKLRNLELLMLIWIDNFEVHIIQHEYVPIHIYVIPLDTLYFFNHAKQQITHTKQPTNKKFNKLQICICHLSNDMDRFWMTCKGRRWINKIWSSANFVVCCILFV